MAFRLPRLLLLGFLWAGSLTMQAGITSFTDRGKTDFDTALPILNPYGRWSQIDGRWAYTPLDHQVPYTNGRWLYTEYGWYWKGNLPHSWATEHYGFWKCGANRVWSWYPGSIWLPQTVEIRQTSTDIGWRSAEVDADGNFVEQPLDRYMKTDEWSFVTKAQFANPITPALLAKPDATRELLEVSTDSAHTYLTYRAIDRPGPHPADFVALCKDGGMFAPRTTEDAVVQPSPSAIIPSPAEAVHPQTGANAPSALLGTDAGANVDRRQVKYWITMSLPTYWTPPPTDAPANQIYLYRPDFYQDQDGIDRRISLWFNPNARTSLRDVLAKQEPNARFDAPAGSGAPGTPAVPAAPTDDSPAPNPFRSPFEDTFHASGPNHAASASSKNPPSVSTSDTNAPIPLPVTNTVPVTR